MHAIIIPIVPFLPCSGPFEETSSEPLGVIKNMRVRTMTLLLLRRSPRRCLNESTARAAQPDQTTLLPSFPNFRPFSRTFAHHVFSRKE